MIRMICRNKEADFDKFRLRGTTARHWEICVRFACESDFGATRS